MSLTTVQQAEESILQSVFPLTATEKICLDKAVGRVLSESVYADRSYPPYDRCMMDGICFSEPSDSFILQGVLHAGGQREVLSSSIDLQDKSKTAWRINTGAPIPPDCTTVVPVEELHFKKGEVYLKSGCNPTAGAFIHEKGSDVVEGECLLPKEGILNAASLSVAASVGRTEIEVYKRPKVFILTTGKEAIPVNEFPSNFEIRRSHPTALRSALQALGITEHTFLHLSDDYTEMQSALQRAVSEHDVVITCGAISKGSSDYLKGILTDLLGEDSFHGVSERPGKPMAYWAPTDLSPSVFALPGNALSTLVTFHRFVAPALRAMMRLKRRRIEYVKCHHTLTDFHLSRFIPVSVDTEGLADLRSSKNSGDFSQLSDTDGFVEFPLGPVPKSPAIVPFYSWL